MSESYTIILNSNIATNRTGNNNNSTYNINWDSFLPPNVKRFGLTVSVRSNLTATVLTTTALVNITGAGGLYVMDQAGSRNSAVIAIIPMSNNNSATPVFAYQSLYSDDNMVLVDRPQSSNRVTVQWTDLLGNELTNVPPSVVFLSYTPLD